MRHNITLKHILLAVVAMLLITACDRITDDTPIPTDTDPAIALVAPQTNNFLDTVGGQISATLRLNDNEALRVFRVVGRAFDQKDSVIGADFIVQEDTITGTNLLQTLTYTVPNLPVYYKVRLTCYAIDSKGAFASTVLYVSVIPGTNDEPVYLLEEYTGDRVYSQLAQNNRFYFSFEARAYLSNILDRDVEEITDTPGQAFQKKFVSPNNTQIGNDSVFVVTSASQFNFDEATYETIFEAFYSDPMPMPETSTLATGDIVIVRLTNLPHFTVLRVTNVNDAPGDANDYIEFDYKVSY